MAWPITGSKINNRKSDFLNVASRGEPRMVLANPPSP